MPFSALQSSSIVCVRWLNFEARTTVSSSSKKILSEFDSFDSLESIVTAWISLIGEMVAKGKTADRFGGIIPIVVAVSQTKLLRYRALHDAATVTRGATNFLRRHRKPQPLCLPMPRDRKSSLAFPASFSSARIPPVLVRAVWPIDRASFPPCVGKLPFSSNGSTQSTSHSAKLRVVLSSAPSPNDFGK